MNSRMDEFREFVRTHPGVRDLVNGGTSSWQKIYEDWVILGPTDQKWTMYQAPKEQGKRKTSIDGLFKSDGIKNVMGYVKKINPDNVSKTLNTVQKVLQITQSFGGKPTPGLYNANYNSWWD